VMSFFFVVMNVNLLWNSKITIRFI